LNRFACKYAVPQGLEDQLLALVVNKERPDLEETKTQLIIQNTEFTIKLKQLEDELLYKLSTAEGDITGGLAWQCNERILSTCWLQDRSCATQIAASGNISGLLSAEDVPLIESLEASKRLATEIGEKVVEASETEVAINDSRNKYRYLQQSKHTQSHMLFICCVVCSI